MGVVLAFELFGGAKRDLIYFISVESFIWNCLKPIYKHKFVAHRKASLECRKAVATQNTLNRNAYF